MTIRNISNVSPPTAPHGLSLVVFTGGSEGMGVRGGGWVEVSRVPPVSLKL